MEDPRLKKNWHQRAEPHKQGAWGSPGSLLWLICGDCGHVVRGRSVDRGRAHRAMGSSCPPAGVGSHLWLQSKWWLLGREEASGSFWHLLGLFAQDLKFSLGWLLTNLPVMGSV